MNVHALLERIDQRKAWIDNRRPLAPEEVRELDAYFRIGTTYSSNALEGNTLTLSETKVLLEDGLTVGGKPLRDCYEAQGHAEAYDFMLEAARKTPFVFSEDLALRLHRLFSQRIDPENAGRYRGIQVFITGTDYVPPKPEDVSALMKEFADTLSGQWESLHPVRLAALAHRGLVDIHPFTDGNGRRVFTPNGNKLTVVVVGGVTIDAGASLNLSDIDIGKTILSSNDGIDGFFDFDSMFYQTEMNSALTELIVIGEFSAGDKGKNIIADLANSGVTIGKNGAKGIGQLASILDSVSPAVEKELMRRLEALVKLADSGDREAAAAGVQQIIGQYSTRATQATYTVEQSFGGAISGHLSQMRDVRMVQDDVSVRTGFVGSNASMLVSGTNPGGIADSSARA